MKRLRKTALGVAAFLLGSYVYSYGAEWAGRLFDEDLVFKPSDGGFTWTADLAGLEPGYYLATLGHHVRPCRAELDGVAQDFTALPGLPYRLRSNLSVAIVVPESGPRPRELRLTCERAYSGDRDRTKPFSEYLVLPYRTGQVIAFLRALLESLIGPGLSLFLVVSFALQLAAARKEGSRRARDLAENWPLMVFAAAGMSHNLVSADVTYYFLDSEQAPYFYVLSRNFLCFAFLAIAGSYSKHRPWLYALNLASAAAGPLVYVFQSDARPLLYEYQMYFYTLATAVAAHDLLRRPKPSRSTRLVQILVLSWLVLQLPTTIQWLTGLRWLSISPIRPVVTIATGILIYLRFRELARRERIEATTARILGAIESVKDLPSLVAQISSIASREVHFRRVSAYLDAFCIGAHDRPGEVLLRVMEQGYRKDTVRDSRVSIAGGRGVVMREALASGRPVARRGATDGAWYVVVPIGRHACINLSDESEADEILAHESRDIIERLLPSLAMLESRLADVAIRQGLALERIRAARGDGRWECEVGAVFADINDYSVCTERFGPPFAEFVSTVYFPALVKAVSRWAVPEFVRGDELYLVSIKDLLPPDVSERKAALETVLAISGFARDEGARLCADHGFPALTLSIGANAGPALLVCDPIKVRTAGRTINDAKRLQEAAPSGGILVHAEAFDESGFAPLRPGKRRLVLIKKNCIPAIPLSEVSNTREAS